MNRREFLKTTAATALATGGIGANFAQAQSKMVLKAADVHPLGYPTVEAVEQIGASL